MSTKTHAGSCHCGNLKFEVDLDLDQGVSRCNCSICAKINATGAVVKPAAFRLLSDRSKLARYKFTETSPADRTFCPTCGIHGFGEGDLPELGGAFVSINVNTLEGVELADLKVTYWDGRHDAWQKGMRDRPWPNLTEAPAA